MEKQKVKDFLYKFNNKQKYEKGHEISVAKFKTSNQRNIIFIKKKKNYRE